MKGVGQMFCNWVEPNGLVKGTCDCQSDSALPDSARLVYYCLSLKSVGHWLDASGSFQAPQGPSLPLPFHLCSLLQTIPQRSGDSHQGAGKGKPRLCPQGPVQTIRLRIQRRQELVT